MGYKVVQIKMPTNYSDIDLKDHLIKRLGFSDFDFKIDKKSLDARKKTEIHYELSVLVWSDCIKDGIAPDEEKLEIEYRERNENAYVIGSGPAGFFAALVLQLSGFDVTIIERGSEVEKRTKAIEKLDQNGLFDRKNNYAFGEGGAGTFSDGKLTSRSKHISLERKFILSEYVKAGAPEEILYLAHPHIGTDNLKKVVATLRKSFIKSGGKIEFDTQLSDLVIEGNKVKNIKCNNSEYQVDNLILATGHSAYETYRMLISRGVKFHTKNFAIGHRIEHPQQLINLGQWGVEYLPGVKAAEYRLATTTKKGVPVYSFCMCPGGNVVAAAAYEEKSVVNGMSYYNRDGEFANAGIVAGIHPDILLGCKSSPLQILDWMDKTEEAFFKLNGSLTIPASKAINYIQKRKSKSIGKSSYLQGLQAEALYSWVPEIISNSIAEGLKDFSRKIRNFDQGILMGFESKTSSPLQVEREKDGRCIGFENLYFVGEGSGYAGGIISSAVDGVKCALSISQKF